METTGTPAPALLTLDSRPLDPSPLDTAPPDTAAPWSKTHRVRAEIESLLVTARPGDPVPAERELAARFGVARETVRQALRDLAVQGRIRRQGRGTVVARPKVVRPLATTADLDGAGFTRTLVTWEDRAAERDTAQELELDPGTPVMVLERLLHMHGEPIGLERIHLSLDRFGWLRAGFDPTTSLTTTIIESGIGYAEIAERIETVLAEPREAALLGCSPAFPLLRLTRRGFDSHGRPIDHIAAHYRADRVVFEARSRAGLH